MTTDRVSDTRADAALADGAYDALLVVNSECVVLAANVAARALFGEQVVGARLGAVTALSELEAMALSVLENKEDSLEEQFSISGRPHRVRAQPVREDGDALIGLVFQNVSELVRLNRARRDMVANISHELRTPIANIRLILDSLFQEEKKPKRKRSISALQAIEREVDSLQSIMQDILDLSMIESGQAILRMVEIPLKGLVEEVTERMLDQFESKSLEVETSVSDDIVVLCDPEQARRVLINLIHNAIKWSPKSGVIKIEATDGEDITIRVSDEGPGVPDEQVDRIFERFYQMDASRSAQEGSGLGLAICKHIVEAHGGRIWAEGNSQQKGGRFLFTLPGAGT